MTAEIYELIFRGLQSKYPGQAIGPHWRRVRVALDGGDGSGNFGHEGRPGKVGGSSEGGGKQQEETKRTSEQHYQQAYEQILSEATPEVRKKMESVKIDFTRDNILPEINKEDADYLGIKVRPFRLKKEIIERQDIKHPLSDKKAQILLSCALYNPEYIGGERDNGCVNFITSLRHNRNPLVLVDVKESEDGYYDIVHYYFLDEKSNKKKRAEKEGRENHSSW